MNHEASHLVHRAAFLAVARVQSFRWMEGYSMTRAPFKMFGKTRMVKVVTYSPPNSEPHNPPKAQWDKEMWIERGEDWYGFLDTALAGKIIRVVTPDDWAEAGP